MVVTEEGRVREPVRPEQEAKAKSPMAVTEEGRVREPVKPEQ
jgi:hypothetical protein